MRNSLCKIGVGCVLDKRKRRGDSEALLTAVVVLLAETQSRVGGHLYLFLSQCPLEPAQPFSGATTVCLSNRRINLVACRHGLEDPDARDVGTSWR